MTAPKSKKSAYPASVADLVPEVRAIAAQLGHLPSQRTVMAAFHVGREKAVAALAEAARAQLHLVDSDAPTGAGLGSAVPTPDSEPDQPGSGPVRTPKSGGTTGPAPDEVEISTPTNTGDTEHSSAPEPRPEPIPQPSQSEGTAGLAPQASGRTEAVPEPRLKVTTRLLVWLSLLAGIAASLAANIAHAEAGSGPRLASAWAPLALLLAVSVAERAPRPSRWWFAALSYLGTAVVALVAAIVSYQHQYALLLSYGETHLAAGLLPLSVDGLVVVASMALISLGGDRR